MHIRYGKIKEIAALVEQYHYSHRPIKACVLAVSFHTDGEGFFGTEGPAQAGIVFMVPPSRWAEPVLELQRMVRRPGYTGPPLTKLVSIGLQKIKQDRMGDLVVSFADPEQNHHGGVYQACSWYYHGKRQKSLDGFVLDGKQFVPRRTAYNRWGTSSAKKLNERFAGKVQTIEPHYDQGKHLYWKPINKAGQRKAKRLGLETNPYPKPTGD